MPNYLGEYNGLNTRERIDKKAKNYYRSIFSRSANYFEVDRYKSDGTLVENFPIQIIRDNVKQKKYKHIITHPDYSVDYGDILYDGIEYYIVTELNYNNTVNQDGSLSLCNNELNWTNGTDTITQKCFVSNSKGGIDTDDDILLPTGKIVVSLQKTPDTEIFELNKRFILGNSFKTAYKIISIDDFTKEGMLIIDMEKDSILDKDDLVNNIAYNGSDSVIKDGVIINSQLDSSYYVASSNDLEVKKYSEIEFSIYSYDASDNLTGHTFNYSISGIPVDSYTITNVDNNNIKISNDGYEGIGTLDITDTDTGEVISINLEFTGIL